MSLNFKAFITSPSFNKSNLFYKESWFESDNAETNYIEDSNLFEFSFDIISRHQSYTNSISTVRDIISFRGSFEVGADSLINAEAIINKL